MHKPPPHISTTLSSPMALRRRILISNSTICTHDCYPSTTPHPSPLSTASSSSSGHRLMSNLLITGVSLASAVLFLILTYYTVLVRRRHADNPITSGGNTSASESEEEDFSHRFWSIPTVGLNDSEINSITAKPYIAGAGGSMADCSVCLGDFLDGQMVRLLPSCGHTFHLLCIDPWLKSHISCPLCRSNILNPQSVSASGDAMEEMEEGEAVDVSDSTMDEELRSNSTVSSVVSDLSLNMDREERSENRVNQSRGKQGSSFSEERQQKNLQEFGGGSTSGSGRIFFFSRNGRSRSSSVLPL